MSRRTWILTAIAAAAVLLATGLILGLRGQPEPAAPTGGLPPAQPLLNQPPAFSPPTQSQLDLATPRGTVTVNNFYLTAAEVSSNGDALVTTTAAYQIVYYRQDGSFLIHVLAMPFEASRQKAEAEFLEILGVSRADACRLEVTVGTSRDVDENRAGRMYGLSFCAFGVE